MSLHTMKLDLGIFGEQEVEIDYHYEPAEESGIDNEGCPETFTIEYIHAIFRTECRAKYMDISFLDNNDFEDVIELLKKDLEDYKP